MAEDTGLSGAAPSKEYIVSVGASAGGLDPCERFFDHAPVDRGYSYVVIQHLSPDFRSLMDELLARHSSMPIHRVEDGMTIEPNTIYLNRPRQILTVSDGKFVVMPEESEDIIRLPIDDFFESIATEYGERAVGVVLSGSGSDGVRGAREIKARGGRVFAQMVDTAKFDSMPKAIVSSKLADGVAPPEELPSLIQKHINGEMQNSNFEVREATDDPTADILALMQDRFGTDFSFYKSETITRRLNRRKDLSGYPDAGEYFRALLNNRTELETLYNDLLIEVTAFFRDKSAFETIEKEVIPEICKEMSKQRQIRVWVPGCASGEEAYSLAILVAEYARKKRVPFNLKILATDIHQRSLSAASAGIYTSEHLSVMPKDVRDRYFEQTGDFFQVRPNWRRSVVFSPHDLLSDPPFTRMDLVSCRNVMIYLTEEAQQKLIALFHFSLRKEGFLFLGPSETTGRLSREFTQISQRWRVFQKARDVRLMEATRLISVPRAPRQVVNYAPMEKKTPARSHEAESEDNSIVVTALHELLEIHAPPGFMVDREGNLVHIFGDARKFLRFAAGRFRNKLENLLIEPLKPHAEALLDRVRHGILVDHVREVSIKDDAGKDLGLRLAIRPLKDIQSPDESYAVFSIDELGRVASSAQASDDETELVSTYAARVSELERSLAATEESLQSIIEEMETSNEELQATNEELMSANEELQSTNEELHSVNEELYTVSAEHERKIEELSELTTDMDHLLKSTEIGTIFLDADLHVRRFTPAASKTFNLIAQDAGRPFAHVTAQFEDISVQEIVGRVHSSYDPEDHEVFSKGRAYLMRVLPYVTAEADHAPGVVITVIEIDELQKARTKIADMAQMQEEVIGDIGQFLVRWNKSDRQITYCNDALADLLGVTLADVVGTDLNTFIPSEACIRIKEATDKIAPGAFTAVRLELEDNAGQIRHLDAMLRAIPDRAGVIVGYQMMAKDMTQDFEYIRALEEVLDVDRHELPHANATGPVEQHELARVEKLLRIVQSYLGAEHLLVTIGPEGEDPQPLELPAVSLPGVVPERTYDTLANLVADDVNKADTYGFNLASVRARSPQKALLSDLEASRALAGPIVARNTVIGRVAFAVSGGDARNFTELELALARIVIRWIGYIWERGRAFDALRRTSDELQLIFDHVPNPIWYKDDQNRILRLNKPAAEAMGTTVEAATGADAHDLVPNLATKQHQDDLAVIQSGKPKLGAVEHHAPSDAWVMTNRVPYTDPSTGERHLLVVGSDVTALKSRDAELAQFTYAASHDLQEPLRKIRHNGELLEGAFGKRLDADGQSCVTVVNAAAERMSGLVDSLLHFSSASQGALTQEDVKLDKLLARALEDHKSLIKEHQIAVKVAALPKVTCDASLIQIVFSNLVSNAIKYRKPKGKSVIEVEAVPDRPEAPTQLSLRFTDNGIGFDAAEASRIFDPLVRLSPNDTAQGSGIGLAICRTICERHGWTLSASSVKGKSATFEIGIPLES